MEFGGPVQERIGAVRFVFTLRDNSNQFRAGSIQSASVNGAVTPRSAFRSVFHSVRPAFIVAPEPREPREPEEPQEPQESQEPREPEEPEEPQEPQEPEEPREPEEPQEP